jgi:hypothetical protein
MADGAAWSGSDVGVGVDVTVPAAPGAPPSGAGPSAPRADVELPPVLKAEGPLDEKTFDEVWAIAVRWEVGDNQVIVPVARKRLVAWGRDVLPLLDGKVETDDGGLGLRAFVDVLKGLREAAGDGVLDFVRRNLSSPSEKRRKVALQLVAELGVAELEKEVVLVLGGADDALARRAAGVLERLGSRAGDATLRSWLARDADERRILAALGALMGGEADVWGDARALLDHPLVSVRSRLATLAAAHPKAYGAALRAELSGEASTRAKRTVLDALVRGPVAPDAASAAAAERLVDHEDWGVRADAARWIRAWAQGDAARFPAAAAALDRRLASETEPYVRFAGRSR